MPSIVILITKIVTDRRKIWRNISSGKKFICCRQKLPLWKYQDSDLSRQLLATWPVYILYEALSNQLWVLVLHLLRYNASVYLQHCNLVYSWYLPEKSNYKRCIHCLIYKLTAQMNGKFSLYFPRLAIDVNFSRKFQKTYIS